MLRPIDEQASQLLIKGEKTEPFISLISPIMYILFAGLNGVLKTKGSGNFAQHVFDSTHCDNKYEFCIIIERYDVSVAKKIDQSESVNKPLTKRGLTNIDSRIWAPPD